ncbi:MAG: hypothetical protein IIC21_04840 [Chloroflexi bacterium]|nr:hypothetical protein [Chloroflexota bacterium]
MYLKVEPKDWNMYSVMFYFDMTRPNSEDDEVRRYLSENGLEPRRVGEDQLEERKFEVLQFGGCYLGSHMQAISAIQRRAMERDLLLDAIPRLLTDGPENAARERFEALPDAMREKALDSLAKKFHVEPSFAIDGQDQVQVVLHAPAVQQAFLALGG